MHSACIRNRDTLTKEMSICSCFCCCCVGVDGRFRERCKLSNVAKAKVSGWRRVVLVSGPSFYLILRFTFSLVCLSKINQNFRSALHQIHKTFRCIDTCGLWRKEKKDFMTGSHTDKAMWINLN